MELAVLVLAPAGHPTSGTGAVVKGVGELVVTARVAGGVYGGATQIDGLRKGEYGKVVVQAVLSEARVLKDPDNGVLLVLEPLGRIEPGGVVFANTNLQLTKQKII